MHQKADWQPSGWRFEADTDPAPGGPLDQYLAVTFDKDSCRATVVFDRRGEYVGHRLFGLSIHEARYVRWSELIDAARIEVRDWVMAYDAGRDPDVKRQQREADDLLATLPLDDDSAFAEQLRAQADWQLADVLYGFGPRRRPGRAGSPDLTYLLAAQAYVERCVDGDEKVGRVAKSLGLPQSTFSRRLDVARKRGLLSGSPRRGEVAGSLTPKARRLIAAAEKKAKETTDGER